MSFLEQLNSYPARLLKNRIQSIQQWQIDSALKSPRVGIDEFICLLSPRMDDRQLETLAESAHRLTTQRFGRPSFVSDGESSTSSNPRTSTKNAIAGSYSSTTMVTRCRCAMG